MMAWLTLLPPYLLALTVLLVILPTVIAILIRIALYQHLQTRAGEIKELNNGKLGNNPDIIEPLRQRLDKTIQYLETVNISAIVEELYSEQEFPFLKFSLRCDKWDYFGNVLPNLLLAFGLLGTFLGITLNLADIGSLIHQESLEDINLVEKLRVPLQSMGIAFITSLIALLCSSILTIVNFFFNTNIARISLISSLEYYLDHYILQPGINNNHNNRLDQAIDRVVEPQQELLKQLQNFQQEITRAFTDSAQIFSESVSTFSTSIQNFEERIDRLEIIIQHENFIEYSATLERCVSDFQKTIDTLERSKVTTNLVTTTQNLNSTQEQLSNTIQALQDCSDLIEKAMETLASSSLSLEEQIREVSQDFYQLHSENGEKTIECLRDLSDKVEASNGIFIEKFDRSNLSIEQIHNTLIETYRNLNNHSEHLQSFGDRIALAIDREGQLDNERNRILSDKIGQSTEYLRGLQTTLNQMIALLDESNNQPDRPNDSLPRWRRS